MKRPSSQSLSGFATWGSKEKNLDKEHFVVRFLQAEASKNVERDAMKCLSHRKLCAVKKQKSQGHKPRGTYSAERVRSVHGRFRSHGCGGGRSAVMKTIEKSDWGCA